MKTLQWATICVTVCILNGSNAAKLEEIFNWKYIDYNWPTEYSKEQAIFNEQYIPENSLPIGLEVWKDKLFITVNR